MLLYYGKAILLTDQQFYQTYSCAAIKHNIL